VSFSFSYQELIVTALAGALLAFLASKWQVSGVLLGALSPMASALIMAIVKAYSSGAAMGGPRLPGLLYILGAFWWFASRTTEVRRAILLVGLRAGVAASVISASVVAGTEVIADKDLTCLVWKECQLVNSAPATAGLPQYQFAAPSALPYQRSAPSSSPGAASGSSTTARGSAVAVRRFSTTAGVDGGGVALLATSLLLGSGILSAAILRRRD
jgi:hypothetical protein